MNNRRRFFVRQTKGRRSQPVRIVMGITVAATVAACLIWIAPFFLTVAGRFLILEIPPQTAAPAEAVVVLNTGVEYTPRLIQAAELLQNGRADAIILNGNRKTDAIRKLESRGYTPACHWCANALRILSLFSVPQEKVHCISAEDAYDTVSEAAEVGRQVLSIGYHRLIITTSKFHTRRAYRIWKDLYRNQMELFVIPAREDPFQPDVWWQSGRQVRWVLAEYGAWAYYFWKKTVQPADELASNRNQ